MTGRKLGNAAVMLIILAAFFGAIVAADSVKQLFYEVRVATGSLAEAQAYYETTQAPATLEEWMQRFNVPARSANESLDDYRKRVGIVVYYNRDELGLGRELGCSTFSDIGPSGQPQPGLACFVTNYGERFKDGDKALADAVAGKNPKDTFVISYQPSSTPFPGRPPGGWYEHRFAAYDRPSGRLKPVAEGWSEQPDVYRKVLPGICSNCHGGTYDAKDHFVIGGQFQPINPSILTFSTMPGYTLADQESRIAALNALTAPCINLPQATH